MLTAQCPQSLAVLLKEDITGDTLTMLSMLTLWTGLAGPETAALPVSSSAQCQMLATGSGHCLGTTQRIWKAWICVLRCLAALQMGTTTAVPTLAARADAAAEFFSASFVAASVQVLRSSTTAPVGRSEPATPSCTPLSKLSTTSCTFLTVRYNSNGRHVVDLMLAFGTRDYANLVTCDLRLGPLQPEEWGCGGIVLYLITAYVGVLGAFCSCWKQCFNAEAEIEATQRIASM